MTRPGRARVLVTGADGQLAGAIRAEYSDSADVLALNHARLDIADVPGVRAAVQEFRPTVIVNCAAYNRVDDAEADPEPALTVNAFGVRVLARAAEDAGATLVHFSTDFVFDGRSSRPYVEEDETNPGSVYAASKLLGEWFAREAPRAFVLRVASLFGGVAGKSSVDRIVDGLMEGRPVKVFVDRTASPSYVVDVAAATRVIVERGEPGLYHCVGSGSCTWHELGQAAAEILGRDGRSLLIPVRAADVPLPAARPVYAALSNARLATIAPMPTWGDALGRYLNLRRLGSAARPYPRSQDTP
jgi:dTDP-4-dehydrorhamnose reductase